MAPREQVGCFPLQEEWERSYIYAFIHNRLSEMQGCYRLGDLSGEEWGCVAACVQKCRDAKEGGFPSAMDVGPGFGTMMWPLLAYHFRVTVIEPNSLPRHFLGANYDRLKRANPDGLGELNVLSQRIEDVDSDSMTMDLVCANLVLHFIPNDKRRLGLETMLAVVNPGGFFITRNYVTHCPAVGYQNEPIVAVDFDWMREILEECGFFHRSTTCVNSALLSGQMADVAIDVWQSL